LEDKKKIHLLEKDIFCQKQTELCRNLKQMICYEKVTSRNQERPAPTNDKRYHFPFVIFSTKDNNQHIECLFEDSAMK
jgi:hypothetical protein